MDPNNNATPISPPAHNDAGQNGATPPPLTGRVTGQDLETALSRLAVQPAESTEPATPPAPGGPETPAAAAAEGIPGQENLTAEAPESTTPEGETENVLSQTDDPELVTALQGVSPDIRKHLLEVAKAKPGEIPRIGRLIAEKGEYVQAIGELQKENQQLRQQVEAAPATGPASSLPEPVARLKTIGEVKARTTLARENIRQLEDFLEENPNGGVIGGKEFARKEVIAYKRTLEDELQALPDRAQQIQSETQHRQAREAARAQIAKDFPEWQDPGNADAKVAQHLLKDPRFAGEVNADYVALALARGHRVLQAELAARQGKANGKSSLLTPGTPHLTRPAGKVPLGKPHAPSGGTAPSANAMKTFQASLPKPGQRVKGEDLERVLAALPT